jgi:hypothetical protein
MIQTRSSQEKEKEKELLKLAIRTYLNAEFNRKMRQEQEEMRRHQTVFQLFKRREKVRIHQTKPKKRIQKSVHYSTRIKIDAN